MHHCIQYLSTSSAIQLKAKFGQGKKKDNNNNNNKGLPHQYSQENTNMKTINSLDGRKAKSNMDHALTNKNIFPKEGKMSAPFTPPTSRKGGGIGLRWEMQHSQESSSMSWEKGKTNFSKSHSNIQDLVVDDGRGFVPSEVAKDPTQKEFLINLSKRIFSNPSTKLLQEELEQRRAEQMNAADRKRSLSAGRNAGLDLTFRCYYIYLFLK